MAGEPAGRGPIATNCRTCSNARPESKAGAPPEWCGIGRCALGSGPDCARVSALRVAAVHETRTIAVARTVRYRSARARGNSAPPFDRHVGPFVRPGVNLARPHDLRVGIE